MLFKISLGVVSIQRMNTTSYLKILCKEELIYFSCKSMTFSFLIT